MKEWLVAVNFTKVILEKRLAVRCETNRNILFSEKRMTSSCEINQSVL